MEIYNTPPILVFCLQRFKSGHKNSDLIDFPIVGLDLKPFVKVHQDNMIYDLYGVINHSGSLNFGHYTA